MKVIAEFVSDEEIFNEIKNMDVDYAQGYFIGKPNKNL
jgi:EAL domain-containing protein (putative c-di-GMP-specific phosphodiesterase class I)